MTTLSFTRPKGSLGYIATGPSGMKYLIRRAVRNRDMHEATCYYIAVGSSDKNWTYRVNSFASYKEAKQRCIDNELGIDVFS